MTRDRPIAQQAPQILIVLASSLTLGLLVPTILDYASRAKSAATFAACLFLPAILSILVIRLLTQTRREVATLRIAAVPQVSATTAFRLMLGLTLFAFHRYGVRAVRSACFGRIPILREIATMGAYYLLYRSS